MGIQTVFDEDEVGIDILADFSRFDDFRKNVLARDAFLRELQMMIFLC